MATEILDILLRLVAAGFLGACIGFERRLHHKAIGIAGMVLIAIGSTTYMLLGRHLAELDPSSISRTLQGFLSGIGFLGGAVIFKSGFDGTTPPRAMDSSFLTSSMTGASFHRRSRHAPSGGAPLEPPPLKQVVDHHFQRADGVICSRPAFDWPATNEGLQTASSASA